jgi:hypothetical protein
MLSPAVRSGKANVDENTRKQIRQSTDERGATARLIEIKEAAAPVP